MPLLTNSTYQPSFIFKNKHINTIYRTLFSQNTVHYTRERLEIPDGDFIDLDFSRCHADTAIIAIHGLEGSSHSTYIQLLTEIANSRGIDVVAMNLRGCSGENNRLLSSYHSGKTDDLELVLEYLDEHHNYMSYHIVGYSLGGNLTLKYLGERGTYIHSKIRSAVAVSVPCDLKASSEQLSLPPNRIYLNRFLVSLKEKALKKWEAYPDSFLSKEKILAITNFKDFDDVYTAPAHGFRDAEDYWKRSSSKQFLPAIRIPTLLINAGDDPFLKEGCYPYHEAKRSDYFFMEAPRYGGHVGFRTSLFRNSIHWCENRILDFLSEQ